MAAKPRAAIFGIGRKPEPKAAFRPNLEALVPRLDDGFLTLLRLGMADRARQEHIVARKLDEDLQNVLQKAAN